MYGRIQAHRQNDLKFIHFWVLLIYDDFTLNYRAVQFLYALKIKYIQKNVLNLMCVQDFISVNRSIKNYVFSR